MQSRRRERNLSPDAQHPIFFVNRAQDHERRRCIEAELAVACVSAERIAAVEGLAVPADLASYFWADDRSTCRLSPGEVGCYASHLRALKIIVERGLSSALIIEDDAVLPPSLTEDLSEILRSAPAGWDVIQLSSDPRHPFKPIAPLSRGRSIVRHSRIPFGMVGYLVSNSGARKLLSHRIRQWPIDTDLRQPWIFGMNVFGVVPKLISHNDALASAVLAYGERSRLRRGVRRPTFRYPLGSPFHTLQGAWFNLKQLGFAFWSWCLLVNMQRRLERALPRRRRVPAVSAGSSAVAAG